MPSWLTLANTNKVIWLLFWIGVSIGTTWGLLHIATIASKLNLPAEFLNVTAWIASSGFLGGLLNSYMTDKGLVSATIYRGSNGEPIVELGFVGSSIIGMLAALCSWALYGPYSQALLIGAASNLSGAQQSSTFQLSLYTVVSSFLVGLAGAKWFSAEVDKEVFKNIAVTASVSNPDPQLAKDIVTGTPQQALSNMMKSLKEPRALPFTPSATSILQDLAMVVKPTSMVNAKFPQAIITLAQKAQQKTKCLASVTLAQWADESGYGAKAPHNNPFGIKWTPNCPYSYFESPTKENRGAQEVILMAKFVAFPSQEAAFDYHANLLMDPDGPYKAALPFAGDWRKFVEIMGPIYATRGQKYVQDLISIIETNQLFNFDQA